MEGFNSGIKGLIMLGKYIIFFIKIVIRVPSIYVALSGLHMAWLCYWIKNGPAQSMDNKSCLIGTVHGTARRQHFIHIIIPETIQLCYRSQ
jgi:hypothetical protein